MSLGDESWSAYLSRVAEEASLKTYIDTTTTKETPMKTVPPAAPVLATFDRPAPASAFDRLALADRLDALEIAIGGTVTKATIEEIRAVSDALRGRVAPAVQPAPVGTTT